MINNIDIFDQFFKDNRLSQIVPLKENVSRGLFIFCAQQNNHKLLVKIVAKKNTKKLYTIQKEYIVNKLLSERGIFVLKTNLLFEINDHKCLLRDFIEGTSLVRETNSAKSAYELFGYDLLQDNLILKNDNLIKQIINIVKKTQNNDQVIPVEYRHFFRERLDSEIKNYNLALIKEKLSITLDDCVNYYEKEKQKYLSNKVFCFGDLVPANIIVLKNQTVQLIDFEWACLDNETMDMSYLWLFFWRYPQLQNILIDNFITEKTKTYFCLSVIRQIIAWYSGNLENLPEKVIIKYKTHIWTKYLENAYDFNKLINTKI